MIKEWLGAAGSWIPVNEVDLNWCYWLETSSSLSTLAKLSMTLHSWCQTSDVKLEPDWLRIDFKTEENTEYTSSVSLLTTISASYKKNASSPVFSVHVQILKNVINIDRFYLFVFIISSYIYIFIYIDC